MEIEISIQEFGNLQNRDSFKACTMTYFNTFKDPSKVTLDEKYKDSLS